MQGDVLAKQRASLFTTPSPAGPDTAVENMLPEILAFCLAKYPDNTDTAMTNAESLLRKYRGQEKDLVSILHAKYGQPPAATWERARELVDTRYGSISRRAHTDAPLPFLHTATITTAITTADDPIVARMQRHRELEDTTWRQVYAAAKARLDLLGETQRRVAMQEVELARYSAELAQRARELQEEERAQGAAKEELAATVTRLQLTLMRLRSALQDSDGSVERISDIEYQRHLAIAQVQEEEDLIQVYRRVLLQHATLYPLSPLCAEVQRVDAELWQLMNEPPI